MVIRFGSDVGLLETLVNNQACIQVAEETRQPEPLTFDFRSPWSSRRSSEFMNILSSQIIAVRQKEFEPLLQVL
jgi:hypothetical protein